MGEGVEEDMQEGVNRGSIREGLVLGLLLHLGIQCLYAFGLMRILGIGIEETLLLLMMIGGATQLPYMVPALVDAQLMRQRPLTARGIAIVCLGAMCLSLWSLAFARHMAHLI
jgi:hypothetical protein